MQVPHFLKVLKRKLFSNRVGKWYIAKKECNVYSFSAERLKEGYFHDMDVTPPIGKRVVVIYDNKRRAFGFADRLRSIVSIYKTCKDLNIEFKILFTHPFKISRYLNPNKVDWEIEPQKLCYNLKSTDICCLEMRTGTDYEIRQHEKWFRKEFKKDYSEFHVRTNAAYSYKYDFSCMFNDLFKPTPLLQKLISDHTNILGREYISTSFRFLDLLGDFNEPDSETICLSQDERESLIQANIEQIKRLHKQYADMKILVNSDSKTFLEHADNLEYTYVVPGNIEHIDNTLNTAENAHDKTLTDFFMIANAKEIFLFVTGKMYNSNFPYAASLIYNRPFRKIEF